VKPGLAIKKDQLTTLLEQSEVTAGMYVRVHGDHLILGRREPVGPAGELEDTDRVRLTSLSSSSYGLSVKRHTGRWERTPFHGSMQEITEVIWTMMQHLVAPWDCTETSGAQH